MAKNKVQCQKGVSLPQLLSLYGTEEQCFDALLLGVGPMVSAALNAAVLKAAA